MGFVNGIRFMFATWRSNVECDYFIPIWRKLIKEPIVKPLKNKYQALPEHIKKNKIVRKVWQLLNLYANRSKTRLEWHGGFISLFTILSVVYYIFFWKVYDMTVIFPIIFKFVCFTLLIEIVIFYYHVVRIFDDEVTITLEDYTEDDLRPDRYRSLFPMDKKKEEKMINELIEKLRKRMEAGEKRRDYHHSITDEQAYFHGGEYTITLGNIYRLVFLGLIFGGFGYFGDLLISTG